MHRSCDIHFGFLLSSFISGFSDPALRLAAVDFCILEIPLAQTGDPDGYRVRNFNTGYFLVFILALILDV